MGRLTKPLDEAAVKCTRMTHTPIREIHLADDLMFNDSLDAYRDIVNKLGQLEDIEEELGIDLVTLFKALFEGAWFKDGEPASFIEFAKKPYLRTDIKPFVIDFFEDQSVHYLKDYGRSWALTKEELL